jgi:hypothetical protein
MRLLRVGEGVPVDDGSGRVVAVFRRAVYVAVPGGLFALVGPDAEPGPLHAHVTRLPAVAVGDPVRVAGGHLHLGGRPVLGGLRGPQGDASRAGLAGGLRGPQGEASRAGLAGGLRGPQGDASRAGLARRPGVWRAPPLPDPGRADAIARTLRQVLDHEPDLDLAAGPAGPSGPAIPDDLEGAADALAGRGAGLTPAGDDVLAGLLLVARMRAGPPAEPRLVALARRARTHDISRAFLAEAARGRSVAALHDLLGAAADGDLAAARRARARLARVGHTSGLDLAYGVLAGCTATAATPPRSWSSVVPAATTGLQDLGDSPAGCAAGGFRRCGRPRCGEILESRGTHGNHGTPRSRKAGTRSEERP